MKKPLPWVRVVGQTSVDDETGNRKGRRIMSETAEPPLAGYSVYDPVDPFENRAGPFFWTRQPDGSCRFAVRATRLHCNSYGLVHGGFLMTLMDMTLVATAKASDSDQLVTVSLNSEFLASGREGDLIEASGDVTRRSRSLVFVRGQVTCGDKMLLTASAVLKPIKSS